MLSSVLACAARGEDRSARTAPPGDFGRCDRVTVGDLKPGLQTGYCTDTGGGWAALMVAHRSQLFAVPDGMRDRGRRPARAVRVRHPRRAARAALAPGETVLVVGAGTVGILTRWRSSGFAEPGHMIVAAKHEKQRAAARLARRRRGRPPEHTTKAVRRRTSAVKLTPERGQEFLLGGVDVALECTGSKSALDMALRTTQGRRPRGRCPASPARGADLTPLWFRELELVGAYTAAADDFAAAGAFELAWSSRPAPMPSSSSAQRTRSRSWRDAIDHAMSRRRARHVQGRVRDPRD